MDSFELHRFSIARACTLSDLPARAIAGVLKHAQAGELPLFAWTLALPQEEWMAMLRFYSPELGTLEPMADVQYAVLVGQASEDFRGLHRLLMAHAAHPEQAQSDWLARALAAAALGTRHLWQDLDLQGRADVGTVLDTYFPQLARGNVHALRWKRYLFQELGKSLGVLGKKPPKCARCDEYAQCFPKEGLYP